MIEAIGWLGTTFLILCGFPQLYKTITTKCTKGLSLLMLYFWFLGLCCMFIYEFFTDGKLPLLANYSVSILLDILLISSVHYYRRKERRL
jgi:uncharacterized protein with PQ loop repeat